MCVMEMNKKGWDSARFNLRLGVLTTGQAKEGCRGLPRRLHHLVRMAGVSAMLETVAKGMCLRKPWLGTWDVKCMCSLEEGKTITILDMKCEQVTLLLKTISNPHCYWNIAYILLWYLRPSILWTTFFYPAFLPSHQHPQYTHALPMPQPHSSPHCTGRRGKPEPSLPYHHLPKQTQLFRAAQIPSW